MFFPKDLKYSKDHEWTKAEAGGAVMLDLGEVENHCEVVVNDAPPMSRHWRPYRFLLTGRVKAGTNTLRITVRHKPQPTLDLFYYRVGPPRLKGPVTLKLWTP
jgi:hypothetical protein